MARKATAGPKIGRLEKPRYTKGAVRGQAGYRGGSRWGVGGEKSAW